jgi:hypothetical protein
VSGVREEGVSRRWSKKNRKKQKEKKKKERK